MIVSQAYLDTFFKFQHFNDAQRYLTLISGLKYPQTGVAYHVKNSEIMLYEDEGFFIVKAYGPIEGVNWFCFTNFDDLTSFARKCYDLNLTQPLTHTNEYTFFVTHDFVSTLGKETYTLTVVERETE